MGLDTLGLQAQHDELVAKVADLESRFKTLVKFCDEQITQAHLRTGSDIVDELVKLRRENEDLHLKYAQARTEAKEAQERAEAAIKTVYAKQKEIDDAAVTIKILREDLDVAKHNAEVYKKQANNAYEKLESTEASYRNDFDRLQQVFFDVQKEAQKHFPHAQCPSDPVEAVRALAKTKQERIDQLDSLVDDLRNVAQKWKTERDILSTDEDAKAYRTLRRDPQVRITHWGVNKSGPHFRVEGPGIDPLRFRLDDEISTPKMVARLIKALTSYVAGEFNHDVEERGPHHG